MTGYRKDVGFKHGRWGHFWGLGLIN